MDARTKEEFRVYGARCTGRYEDDDALFRALGQIVDPQHQRRIYQNLLKAARLTDEIKSTRKIGYQNLLFSHPLDITKEIAELEQHRVKSSTMGLKKQTIDEATLIAAALYPFFRFTKPLATNQIDPTKSPEAQIDPEKQLDEIERSLELIRKTFQKNPRFADEVTELVKNMVQVSEMNYLNHARKTQPSNGEEEKAEAEAQSAFCQMIAERSGRPAMFIRGLQFFVYMKDLRSENGEPNLRGRTEQQWEDAVERAAHHANNTWLPLISAFEIDGTRTDYQMNALKTALRDELFRLTDYEGWLNVNTRRIMLAKEGAAPSKEQFVTNLPTMDRLIMGDQVLEAVKTLIPEEHRDNVRLEWRIKSLASLAQKAQLKGWARATNDTFGVKVIYTVPDSAQRFLDPWEIAREEYKGTVDIAKGITQSIKKAKGAKNRSALAMQPNETKRGGRTYRVEENPDKSRKKNYLTNPKKSGYSGIHMSVLVFTSAEPQPIHDARTERSKGPLKGSKRTLQTFAAPAEPKEVSLKVELQFVGAETNKNNVINAKHADYKRMDIRVDLARALTETSIEAPGKQFLSLPHGANVADYLAKIEPSHAFSATDIRVERLHYADPPKATNDIEWLNTPMQSGDRLFYTPNPKYVFDAQHRQQVIAAATREDTRAVLIEADQDVARVEAALPSLSRSLIRSPSRAQLVLPSQLAHKTLQ